MALPATEPFTGTGALSASWTLQRNSCDRSSDRGRGVTTVVYNTAFWNADTFNADQYSQTILSALGSNGSDYYGVSVRASGTNGASTESWYAQFYTNGTDNDLLKCRNNTITTIANNLGGTPSAGQLIRLEATGTGTVTLKSFKAGSQQGTDQTDNTNTLDSGSAGIVFFDNGGRIDDWEGGNIGGGGGGGATSPGWFHSRGGWW